MLKFSPANAKTRALALVDGILPFLQRKRKIYSLDLLSGHYCPFAKDCLSKAVLQADGKTRKIQDGPDTQFRCFSASQEVIYDNVFKARKFNSDLLRHIRGYQKMKELINASLPKNIGVCRIHVAGDFFNQSYFDAWLDVTSLHQDKLFYAYTKSLPYWVLRLYDIPDNFVLTASFGGRKDALISDNQLRYAKVVYSEDEANYLGLEIDHDDSHAANPLKWDDPFALLIHGIQPKGSLASKVLSALKGKGSYTRKGGEK